METQSTENSATVETAATKPVGAEKKTRFARSAALLRSTPKWALITIPAVAVVLAGYGYTHRSGQTEDRSDIVAMRAAASPAAPFAHPDAYYRPYYGPYYGPANYGNGYSEGYGYGRGYGRGHGHGSGRMNASFGFGGNFDGNADGGGNGAGNGFGHGRNGGWW